MNVFSSISSLFTMTDEQAMWRVQTSDDPQAFAQLVRRWEGPIQALCTRMTGDPHRGEDLAQDAFVRVFARRKEYEPRGHFSTFLWRVAVNLCHDELRRRHRRAEFSLEESDSAPARDALEHLATATPTPDETLVEQERRELVRQAVLLLPETYRTVVVLRHYENLKFREIAEILEIPEGTVKSRMAEALAQLNRILSRLFEPTSSDLCKTPSKRIEESLIL